MKKLCLTVFTASLMVLTGCKSESKKSDTSEATPEAAEKAAPITTEAKKVKVAMEPKSDTQVKGNVVFTEENGEVTMVAVFEGLEAGDHAIHLHEKADCSAPDGTSTGGHWNPTYADHGQWGSPDGYHKGDIGNFMADENGNGTITFSTDEWCIGCGDANKDILGKAVIVHAGKDDFITQPTGDAGGRVSCGGVIQ